MKSARRSVGAQTSRGERGFALMIVLLVLLALLVLCTPFLISARNADRASAQLSDRAYARIALDTAARHARAHLYDSHPSRDTTPYWDSLDEIDVDAAFAREFLDARDANGVMWDLDVSDTAGKIDLNSASPHVIANLIGASTRFTEAIAADAKTLPLSSVIGFEPTGFVWCHGELIQYTAIAETALVRFQRGVLGPASMEDWLGGPRAASMHDAGAPVLDQRAFALALWRVDSPDGELHELTSMEELTDAGRFALARAVADSSASERTSASDPWSIDVVRPLFLHGSVHAGVRAGAVWQRAARLTTPVQGGKDGKIGVDNTRWMNPGATIQISDGTTTELAIVAALGRGDEVYLDKILVNDYEAYRAQVRVLARRPVNLNTADVEVLRALFTNLQIAGRNARITRDEAHTLADVVVESRPFEGFEDFLRRVVLPSAGLEKLPADAPTVPDALVAGEGFLDASDALALYRNGLNANDSALAFATMPYCFTTRDTYALELRASVNARSGVERFAAVRDEVSAIAPQQELLSLWSRQEDFDEAARLSCESPWWASGPSSTTRWEHAGAVPPSPVWAHMGTARGQPYLPGVTDMTDFASEDAPPQAEHVFPSREADGFVELWPSRVYEVTSPPNSGPTLTGRVIHFDHETRDVEGRYLPDQVVERATSDRQVRWTDAATTTQRIPLLRALSFSLWVKPRAVGQSVLLDVGGSDVVADRLSLAFDGPDLVLRLLDAVGDHRQTARFVEAAELRYALAPGNGPGLPLDTWSHIDVDVRGSRPDQMSMLVNGLAHGVRKLGSARLTSAAPQEAGVLAVDSVEGFPPYCTVRVGNELIEVQVDAGTNTLIAARQETGEYAGFGGRMARERTDATWTIANDDDPGVIAANLPVALADVNYVVDHPAGTTVELYGYSLPLDVDVPTGKIDLRHDLGPFRVAMLTGVVGGQTPQGDPITSTGSLQTWGFGLEGSAFTEVTGLVLRCADDPNVTDDDFMPAFQPGGGYAALVQFAWSNSDVPNSNETINGTPLGGVEVIRYIGYDGNVLQVQRRGDQMAELQNLAAIPSDLSAYVGGTRAFIATWAPQVLAAGNPAQEDLRLRTFVVPISLQVEGATAAIGFLDAQSGASQFAQLTHTDIDAEMTEWLRYDWFETTVQPPQLVRDDPSALVGGLYNTLIPQNPPSIEFPTPPGGGGGPGSGGSGGGPVQQLQAGDASSSSSVVAMAAQGTQAASTHWEPRIGTSENAGFAITDSVISRFQFRGVMGTYTHLHEAGTAVLPVFSLIDAGADAGRPGRMDAAFLVNGEPTDPGQPVRVHRAHQPADELAVVQWTQVGATDVVEPTPPGAMPLSDTNFPAASQNRIYLALQDQAPGLTVAGGAPAQAGTADPRERGRLTCFPSGERPRIVQTVVVGGGFDGPKSGAVPSALVDEIVFGDAQLGTAATLGGQSAVTQGASMILQPPGISETDLDLLVYPRTVRTTGPNFVLPNSILSALPQDGGLLRIGTEILAYSTRDLDSGAITVAANGRGLLGTIAQPHHAGETVTYLESHVATYLTGNLDAASSVISVASTAGFPNEGTLLIGSELVHYTRKSADALEMPRASSAPGRMDEKGEALFRGRFGTTRAAHTIGQPVILFPFRYWDRWAERADAPELAYFGLSLDEPSGLLASCFFAATEGEASQIGVLQRTDPDAPWDADPETDSRLRLYWKGDDEGRPFTVTKQSERVDWRVFVKYSPGAFDLATGLPSGWRQTPRLTRFGAFHYAPNTVLRSVER